MALEKTWRFDMNRGFTPTSALELTQYQLWYIKAFLLGQIGGATQGLWTLVGSSDGVTAGNDSTDRWGGTFDPTKIIRSNAGVRSWVALQATINGIQITLVLDFSSASDANFSVYWFRGSRTVGGTTTSFPPASGLYWGMAHNGPSSASTTAGQMNDGTINTVRFSAALSTTGDFYILCGRTGTGFANMAIITWGIANPKASDTVPFYTYAYYWNTNLGPLDALRGSTSSSGSSAFGTYGSAGAQQFPRNDLTGVEAIALMGNISIATTSNASVLSTNYAQIDSINGATMDFPVHVAVSVGSSSGTPTSTRFGYKGRLPDMALATAWVPQGSIDNASPTMSNCGNLWLPANAAFNFGA